MGKREKRLKAAKVEEISSSEEGNRTIKNPIEEIGSDDDEEANEDLSLKIVQKAMLRASNNNPEDDGVSKIVAETNKDVKKKEKKKRKKSSGTEVPDDTVSGEIDNGFKDFCGELFLVDNMKGEDKLQTDKSVEMSEKAVEANPVEVSDNAVLRKLLRGPRYFDPPDNSWGACYNCGEEGHMTANCTSARRKKPCFVCGSFEHNAKQCTKGRDCFICKQRGHRARECPEKNSSKICLKCGDIGHDMFSCRNEYSPDDLKEIQCYVCHSFGHLCCVDYGSPSKRVVSCYRCGQSGHTGLACTGSRGDINGAGYFNSCYKCGGEGHFARECTSSQNGWDTNGTVSSSSCYKCGGEGHFARECTSSKKSGKRNREHSTPKQKSSKKDGDHREHSTPKRKSSKKDRDRVESRSGPEDLGKTRKKKKSQRNEFSSAGKTKHRGGWITEDPEYFYNSMPRANNWRSPATPSDRRSNMFDSNGDYASSSHSSKRSRKLTYSNSALDGPSRYYQHSNSASNSALDGPSRYYQHNNSASNGSSRYYQHNNSASNGSSGYYEHRFSASRFGNNSHAGTRRNDDWW